MNALRERAARTAEELAARLRDPEAVAAHVRADPHSNETAWDDAGLLRGPAALGLLAAERLRLGLPGAEDDVARLLQVVFAATAHRPVDGPMQGLAALARLVHHVGGQEALSARLDERVAEHARWLSESVTAIRREGQPCYLGTVDVLTGVTGHGRYLLAREHDAVHDVLSALVGLAGEIVVDGTAVPAWWAAPTERTVVAPEFEHGRLTFGLAHGVAGPLMLLALARRRGVSVPGQDDAIRTFAHQLLQWRDVDAHGPYWTGYVPLVHVVERDRRPVPSCARASWCYGSAGNALALHEAGLALGEQGWTVAAGEAWAAELARDDVAWGIRDDMLCHGRASMAHLIGVGLTSGAVPPAVRAVALERWDRLMSDLLDDFDEAAPFGYRYPDPGSGAALDQPGLLEGSTGIALVLLGFAHDAAPSSEWDQLLLLR